MKTNQVTKYLRIRELHEKAQSYWPEIESVIDELKTLGPIRLMEIMRC